MDSQKVGRGAEEEPLPTAGRSDCAGEGHFCGRRAQMEKGKEAQRDTCPNLGRESGVCCGLQM